MSSPRIRLQCVPRGCLHSFIAPPGEARLYVLLGQPVVEGHQGGKSTGGGRQEVRKKGMGWSGDTMVWIQGKEKEQDLPW